MVEQPVPEDLGVDDALRLASILRELLGLRRPAAVARRLCEAVRELVGADGATFVLRESDLVHYAEEDAIGALWKGRRFPATACISGWAVIHGETAIIEDIFADPRIPVETYRPTFVKSLLMTPVGRKDPVGAIGAYWRERRRPTHREAWLLEQIAEAAASAFPNATAQAQPASESVREPEPFGRLVPVVAHDLRQPLSTIIYAAATLHHMVETRGRGADLLRQIERAAARASELITELLDCARLQDGALPLRLELVRIDELCESVSSELCRGNDSIHLDGEPVEGLCDPARLQQAIGNLVRNAVQHGDANQPVVLRVRRDGEDVRIQVHNQGPVIPEYAQARIYAPFQRLSEGPTPGSAGLGLYIAHQVIQAHGGAITLCSNRGNGTTFTVTLPTAPTTLQQTGT